MKAALFPAIWLALGLAVALSVAGGCTLETTFGHGSSQAPASTALAKQRELIRRIELCRTREAELRQQFGEPRRDGRFQRSRILTWLPEGGKIERVFSVLLDRDAWGLAERLTGDQGLGRALSNAPELVVHVDVDGANPDVDTPADLPRLDQSHR